MTDLLRKLYNLYFSPQKKFAQKLRSVFAVSPVRMVLYELAFQHSSAYIKLTENNERLELLGDSVIDLVVSDHLFHVYPYKSEGFMTEMRSKIVSRKQLNKMALEMGLKELIRRKASESDFKKSSIAGNALEALVGAIYLDQGYDVAARFVLEKMIHPYIDLDELSKATFNFKSKLLEWCQKRQKKLRFRMIEERRENAKWIYTMGVVIDDEDITSGTDFSKKKAEQRASEAAIEQLGIELN